MVPACLSQPVRPPLHMSNTRFTLGILLAACVWANGCATRTPDPLAGWYFCSLKDLKSNKAIDDDYRDYIQNLAPEDRSAAGPIEYFQDGGGQHAVLIWEGLNGTVWRHILIYNSENKRVRSIKYASGSYQS